MLDSTPCRFSKRVFDKAYPKVPVYVCPEGINPDVFKFHERSKPAKTERFRFLFLGAAVNRKGLSITGTCFNQWRDSGTMPDNAELYIKTSGLDNTRIREVHTIEYDKTGNGGKISPRVIIDSRNLPESEIVNLYNTAHAFILPSHGEGWGLTLTEAMATGLPSIWTHWSAMQDYADSSIGYPLKRFKAAEVHFDNGFTSGGVEPSKREIVEKFHQVYHGYETALDKGRRASERMHGQYTWDHAAERFIEICRGAVA